MQLGYFDWALPCAFVCGFQMAVGRPPKVLVQPVAFGRWYAQPCQTIGSRAPPEFSDWLLSVFDSRTAGYAIRTISGVGGGPREGTPYPDRLFFHLLQIARRLASD